MAEVATAQEVLYQITREDLESGLRDFPVGICQTSDVDPFKGLTYGGLPISQIADWSPERVIYLLYYGKDGSTEQIRAFTHDLASRSHCKPELLKAIKMLPREGHPMALFSMALLLAGVHHKTGDYKEDCLNVIAQVPQLVAAVINHHGGFGDGKPSNPNLGYMENFVHMLAVPGIEPKSFTQVMRLFDVLHFDHGGGNLSTFVGKAVASGLEDMYGSLSSAMCALAGPRHGKANQECLEFVEGVHAELGDKATTKDVENLIRQRLANKQLVFGFGHAVLRVEDPRATVLYAAAERLYPKDPLVRIASYLRVEGVKVLKENPKIASPYPNVDIISGTLLKAAGFKHPEYFTVLFGLSRCVGISIQIYQERCLARGGKGLPIVRPQYLYVPRNS